MASEAEQSRLRERASLAEAEAKHAKKSAALQANALQEQLNGAQASLNEAQYRWREAEEEQRALEQRAVAAEQLVTSLRAALQEVLCPSTWPFFFLVRCHPLLRLPLSLS